jgi:hypothetical protein
LLTDFVCLYNYEFWLSLCKIVDSCQSSTTFSEVNVKDTFTSHINKKIFGKFMILKIEVPFIINFSTELTTRQIRGISPKMMRSKLYLW